MVLVSLLLHFSVQRQLVVLVATIDGLSEFRVIDLFKLKLQWTRQFRVSNEINEACLFETKVERN